MISVVSAIALMTFGASLALFGVLVGVVVHTRWIDRKLAPKKPLQVQVKHVP